MTKIIETNIESLVPDNKNFNKGTEYGDRLMDESLRKFGLARSVVIDKNNRIIAGNINQVLKVDSVVCDFNAYPYRAVTYATQKIIRQSNVTERSLVTTCRLLNASRSDDNPNGFTIEGFTIIENKDLQTIKR